MQMKPYLAALVLTVVGIVLTFGGIRAVQKPAQFVFGPAHLQKVFRARWNVFLAGYGAIALGIVAVALAAVIVIAHE